MSEARVAETRKARRFRRMTVKVEVEIRSADRTCSSTATTLGAGGFFIEMDDPFLEHTPLILCFQLPGSEQMFEIQGRVVWSTPPNSPDPSRGMGVAFTDRVAISALAREIASGFTGS